MMVLWLLSLLWLPREQFRLELVMKARAMVRSIGSLAGLSPPVAPCDPHGIPRHSKWFRVVRSWLDLLLETDAAVWWWWWWLFVAQSSSVRLGCFVGRVIKCGDRQAGRQAELLGWFVGACSFGWLCGGGCVVVVIQNVPSSAALSFFLSLSLVA